MKQVPRFTQVHDEKVLDAIRHLFDQCEHRELARVAGPFPKLTDEELGEELFAHGLPNESVDKVLLALQRQRRLAQWVRYRRAESRQANRA